MASFRFAVTAPIFVRASASPPRSGFHQRRGLSGRRLR